MLNRKDVEDLSRAVAIAERRWNSENGHARTVMVALTGGFSEKRTRRHLRLLRDDAGLYVRMGKRLKKKTYLRDMAGARLVDPDLNLAVFYEIG